MQRTGVDVHVVAGGRVVKVEDQRAPGVLRSVSGDFAVDVRHAETHDDVRAAFLDLPEGFGGGGMTPTPMGVKGRKIQKSRPCGRRGGRHRAARDAGEVRVVGGGDHADLRAAREALQQLAGAQTGGRHPRGQVVTDGENVKHRRAPRCGGQGPGRRPTPRTVRGRAIRRSAAHPRGRRAG